MKRFIKNVCVTLVLVMTLVSSYQPIVSEAEEHVHEMGSYEYVERVIDVIDVIYQYSYEVDGQTYDVYIYREWCLFYKACYCGYRGEYREGGRSREVTIRAD